MVFPREGAGSAEGPRAKPGSEILVKGHGHSLDWSALARQALGENRPVRVLLPSHEAEVFEMATGAWGRFEEIVTGLRTLSRAGVGVLIDHPITLASLHLLPDLPRWVDEVLEGGLGISFWRAAGPDAPNDEVLRPWWEATLHACRSRGIGVEIGEGLSVHADTPGVLPSLDAHPEGRGFAREHRPPAHDRHAWIAVLQTPTGPAPGASLAAALTGALGLPGPRALTEALTGFTPLPPARIDWHGPRAGVAPEVTLAQVVAARSRWPAATLRLPGWSRDARLEAVRAALPDAQVVERDATEAPSWSTLVLEDGSVRAAASGTPGCALAEFPEGLAQAWGAAAMLALGEQSASGQLRGAASPVWIVIGPEVVAAAEGDPSDRVRCAMLALVEALARAYTVVEGGVVASVALALDEPTSPFVAELRARCAALGATVWSGTGGEPETTPGPRQVWSLQVVERDDDDAPLRAPRVSLPERPGPAVWGATVFADEGLVAFSPSPAALADLARRIAGRAPSPRLTAVLASGAQHASLTALRVHGIDTLTPHRAVALRPAPADAAPIVVDPDRCRGHGTCAVVCPTGALQLVPATPGRAGLLPTIDGARCSRCHACIEHCPSAALSPTAPHRADFDVGGVPVWNGAPLAAREAQWLQALRGDAAAAQASLPPTWQRPRARRDRVVVLGVAASTRLYHAACLLIDGVVVGAVQEERFRRRKQYGWALPGRPEATAMADPRIPLDGPLPWASIRWLLEHAGIGLDEVDVIALNGIPARLQSTYSATDPARPPLPLRSGRVASIPHHLAHAASAWALCGRDDVPVFTVDGRGERETAALFVPGPRGLERRWDLLVGSEGTSIGGVYETITRILGFGSGGAGSTMGLAPWGRPTMDLSAVLSARDHLRVTANFTEAQRRFGALQRRRGDPLTDDHRDLAASTQQALEATVLTIVRGALGDLRPEALCLAGGVALNCSLNARIRSEFGLRALHVQPAAHDGGTALGAAVEAHRMVTGSYPVFAATHDYLGPDPESEDLEAIVRRWGLPYRRVSDPAGEAAARIAEGQVICWQQGRMEFGPRALGARSVLADPRRRHLRDRLNRMKGREYWRPLGCSILAGSEGEWFERALYTPHMLETVRVRRDRREQVPVIVHVDGTVRPQSVRPADHARLHALLTAFAARTGVPLVTNTSFNTAHEPIVCTAGDGLASFLQLEADALYLGELEITRAAVERLARGTTDGTVPP